MSTKERLRQMRIKRVIADLLTRKSKCERDGFVFDQGKAVVDTFDMIEKLNSH